MSKGQSLQDPFLNALRKERVPVSIFLVNGIKLQGTVESFDQFAPGGVPSHDDGAAGARLRDWLGERLRELEQRLGGPGHCGVRRPERPATGNERTDHVLTDGDRPSDVSLVPAARHQPVDRRSDAANAVVPRLCG